MTTRPELAKNFDPASFEMRWYRAQEDEGFFRPEAAPDGASPFTLVIPPPNVTGRLHVGHALGRTLEDVLCRWRRMQGRAVLWVPGVDHAGIATQMVVERDLKERTGQSRHDLGREAFVALCREWAEARRGDIVEQIRRLGASCDFSRVFYTLDETRSRAVRHAFTTLYHEGLAYRAERMVNWCPSCATVLSDLEVNHVESSGHLYSIAYPFEGGEGELVVATTRPETMLGDTALAVHPDDERYAGAVGKRVVLPLTGRSIPVIADAYVDPKFGTGVVKVTPAHDPNDFEAGRRNGLPSVVVIGFDGKMTAEAGAYAGLDRFDARKKILRDLEAQGLRRGEKSHVIPLARCQRSDTIVEPLVSLQWYVKIAPLAEKAVAATEAGETRFVPEPWKKTYDEWMRNIRDWCISRQLWWGHAIPAWYCPDEHITVPRPGALDPTGCGTCGHGQLRRDPDVFDTWFSSWLLPLSALGWPEKTPDFGRFYPTSVLVTGFDIIFFWVARMIMAGTFFDGRAPFAEAVLHGLVRDEKGQKMSKTKGNVVDPLEMCDEFGADAVRFTLAVLSGTGRDLPFGKTRVAGYRGFATKVWNAARFALQMLDEGAAIPPDRIDFASLGTVDRWILARLSETSGSVSAALEAFRFDEAANALYQFFWSEFCDGYLEMAKPVLRGADVPEAEKEKTRGVLRRVLLDSLALLHPFMPFVSCEIREALNGDGLRLAMTKFPEPNAAWKDDGAVEAIGTLRAVVTRIRNLRAENGLAQSELLGVGLELPEGPLSKEMRRSASLLSHLARLKTLEISSKVDIAGAFRDVVAGLGLVVDLPKKEMSDQDRVKLGKELGQIERDMESLQKKLSDESFLSRAPATVVAKTKLQLEELSERHKRLSGNLVLTEGV